MSVQVGGSWGPDGRVRQMMSPRLRAEMAAADAQVEAETRNEERARQARAAAYHDQTMAQWVVTTSQETGISARTLMRCVDRGDPVPDEVMDFRQRAVAMSELEDRQAAAEATRVARQALISAGLLDAPRPSNAQIDAAAMGIDIQDRLDGLKSESGFGGARSTSDLVDATRRRLRDRFGFGRVDLH
jgi:hypothetical protein